MDNKLLVAAISELFAVLDAHEIETLDCDRCGVRTCDCLSRAREKVDAAISQQEAHLSVVPDVCICCNSIPTHECTACHMKSCAEHSDFCRNCGSETPMRISEDQIIRYARRLQSLCKKAAHVIREMEDNHRAGKPGFSADDEDFGRFVAELEDA